MQLFDRLPIPETSWYRELVEQIGNAYSQTADANRSGSRA
jgi:hypothetical protein